MGSSSCEILLPSDEELEKEQAEKKKKKRRRRRKTDSDGDEAGEIVSPRVRRRPGSLFLEVTPQETKYRLKHFNSENILERKVNCTSCNKNLKSYIVEGRDVFCHPVLRVLLCKDCCNFYGDGNFSMDEDGSDKYCRWCGQGGSLYCCSFCSCAFCRPCIKRNLNRSILDDVKSELWKCFICEPKPLWDHRALCSAAQEHANQVKRSQKSANKSKLVALCNQKTSPKDSRALRLKRRKKTLHSSEEESSPGENSEEETVKRRKSKKKDDDSSTDSEKKTAKGKKSDFRDDDSSTDSEKKTVKGKKSNQKDDDSSSDSEKKTAKVKKSKQKDNDLNSDLETKLTKGKKGKRKDDDSSSDSERKSAKGKKGKRKEQDLSSDSEKRTAKSKNGKRKDDDSSSDSERKAAKDKKGKKKDGYLSSESEKRTAKSKKGKRKVDDSSSDSERKAAKDKKGKRKDKDLSSDSGKRTTKSKKGKRKEDGSSLDLEHNSLEKSKMKGKNVLDVVTKVDRRSAKKACLWLQDACNDISKVADLTSSRSNDIYTEGVNILNMTKVKNVAKAVDSIQLLVKLSVKNLQLASENVKLMYNRWLSKQQTKQEACKEKDTVGVEVAKENGTASKAVNQKAEKDSPQPHVDTAAVENGTASTAVNQKVEKDSPQPHVDTAAVVDESVEMAVDAIKENEAEESLSATSIVRRIKIKSVDAINEDWVGNKPKNVDVVDISSSGDEVAPAALTNGGCEVMEVDLEDKEEGSASVKCRTKDDGSGSVDKDLAGGGDKGSTNKDRDGADGENVEESGPEKCKTLGDMNRTEVLKEDEESGDQNGTGNAEEEERVTRSKDKTTLEEGCGRKDGESDKSDAENRVAVRGKGKVNRKVESVVDEGEVCENSDATRGDRTENSDAVETRISLGAEAGSDDSRDVGDSCDIGGASHYSNESDGDMFADSPVLEKTVPSPLKPHVAESSRDGEEGNRDNSLAQLADDVQKTCVDLVDNPQEDEEQKKNKASKSLADNDKDSEEHNDNVAEDLKEKPGLDKHIEEEKSDAKGSREEKSVEDIDNTDYVLKDNSVVEKDKASVQNTEDALREKKALKETSEEGREKPKDKKNALKAKSDLENSEEETEKTLHQIAEDLMKENVGLEEASKESEEEKKEKKDVVKAKADLEEDSQIKSLNRKEDLKETSKEDEEKMNDKEDDVNKEVDVEGSPVLGKEMRRGRYSLRYTREAEKAKAALLQDSPDDDDDDDDDDSGASDDDVPLSTRKRKRKRASKGKPAPTRTGLRNKRSTAKKTTDSSLDSSITDSQDSESSEAEELPESKKPCIDTKLKSDAEDKTTKDSEEEALEDKCAQNAAKDSDKEVLEDKCAENVIKDSEEQASEETCPEKEEASEDKCTQKSAKDCDEEASEDKCAEKDTKDSIEGASENKCGEKATNNLEEEEALEDKLVEKDSKDSEEEALKDGTNKATKDSKDSENEAAEDKGSEKASKDSKDSEDMCAEEDTKGNGDSEKAVEKVTKGSDGSEEEALLLGEDVEMAESASEKSELAKIKRLVNLKTLKPRGGKKKAGDDSSDEGSKKKQVGDGKKSAKKSKKDDGPTLSDFQNMSDSDDAAPLTSPAKENKYQDLESSFKELYDRLEKKRNEMAKNMLLHSTSSDTESKSDEGDEKKKKKKIKEKKVKSEDCNGKVKEEAVSDAKEDDDDDDDDIFDKKKKSWRSTRLLKGKLVDTSSSEEERRWQAKKEREQEERDKKQARRRSSRRLFSGSDSDEDAPSVQSSSSSSEAPVKSSKRKAKSNSTSEDSDSSDSSRKKKKKKPAAKRRRIKTLSDSDSDSDNKKDSTQGDTPGKGRKNIRAVMKDDSVAEATRKAAKEEEERRKRIAEKQDLYNKLYNELQEGVEKVQKLILDFNPETKEELVKVDDKLVQKLKPHQAKGIKFMWDACFESLKDCKKSKGSGCILAHCMGLGKTFQVVTLVHTLMRYEETKVSKVLIVCPLSTVLNWVNEFNMWLKEADEGNDIEVFELSRYKKNFERAYHLKEWHESGGVMVLGYDMYRNLTGLTTKKARKTAIATFNTTLVDPGPDLVVCDEGHLLKNEDTALSKAMRKIRTLRRIVLTGTPLQNNLKEYHCMVQFVKPNLLGTRKEFLNRFVNPITNGQFEDSTSHDVKVMKRRAHVLHKMLEGCVQRFDYSVLMPFLPPKHEYVISVRLTELQSKLYQHYLVHLARGGSGVGSGAAGGKGAKLFTDFQALQRIWTHPRVVQMNADKVAEKKLFQESDSEGSLKDFIDDEGETTEPSALSSSSSEESSDSDVKCMDSDGEGKKKKGEVINKWQSSTRSGKKVKDEMVEEEKVEEEPASEWWETYLKSREDLESLKESSKLMLLFSILRESEKIGDKVLVFSQSLFSLDLIEYFLGRIDSATQNDKPEENLCNHTGSWSPGLDYFRLDGSTSSENRNAWCKIFNKEDNYRARLFLISTRAGGLGINLYAANRVIIFDASWNPSHDVQSIFRVYRFGQKKPCYIYRFLALGTMEEKIYDRQIAKLSISCRVVDEQQIERHFNFADLTELYSFDPEQKAKRPTPILPKDRLLAELLKQHESIIETYHEHDSLLENKQEEELNEEERKAAWEDYENEKKGLVVQQNPFQGTGYDLNLMLQYSQLSQLNPQIIRAILKKQYPTMTEEQLQQQYRLVIQQIYEYTRGMNAQNLVTVPPPGPGAQGAQGAQGALTQQQLQQQQQMYNQQMLQQQMQQQGLSSAVKYQFQQMLRHKQLQYHATQAAMQRPPQPKKMTTVSKHVKVTDFAPLAQNNVRQNPFAASTPPPAHSGSTSQPQWGRVSRALAANQKLLNPLSNSPQKPTTPIVMDTIDVED